MKAPTTHSILIPLFVVLTPDPVSLSTVAIRMARVPATLFPFRIPILLRAPPKRLEVIRSLVPMAVLLLNSLPRLDIPITVHLAVKTPPKFSPGI